MSNPAANVQGQKQVLRTAMVGVQPGDQVMLKGYLRVLLRLEADLEWVAANSQSVHLFIINSQFKSVDSVQNLLSKHTSVPVLYVSRHPMGEGGMEADKIILPLKKLNVLNEWLLGNLSVLQTKAKNRRKTNKLELDSRIPIEVDVSEEAQSVYAANDNDNHDLSVSSSDQAPKSDSIARADLVPSTNKQGQQLLEFIKKLEQKESHYYELWIKNEKIAIVHPKLQLIWLESGATSKLFKPDNSWQLRSRQDDSQPLQFGKDLVQWLWEQAWNAPNALLPLVSSKQKFQLRYWVKPINNESRRELLRLFTALETKAQTLTQIAQITEASTQTASQTLAALLFSGCLMPSVYAFLESDINADSEDIDKTPIDANDSISISTASSMSIEDILARRKSGEVAPTIGSSIDLDHVSKKSKPTQESNVSTKGKAPPKKSEKLGFLSRLRDKLGL